MKYLLMLLLVFVLSSFTNEKQVELRIYNDSKFKIERIKISFKGHEIEYKNIESKSYSETKAVDGLWKDNCYDLTIYKKNFFTKNFWAHQICYPVDHISDNKIENGKYTLKLKIKQKDKKSFSVESEYITENKNE
ncbi:hypothetical protein [Flavobacterium sp. JAS]|uniref:hypothetical protein n=1 Tax=Flavobacterium sp. JAS TaxID=2897329 RepID=UPI001E30E8E9|nr:hypothetical protein [Flavobacterium sp. JAS]MCD0471746.1 hypothetical protein [Flavobacterium sp. JAS]